MTNPKPLELCVRKKKFRVVVPLSSLSYVRFLGEHVFWIFGLKPFNVCVCFFFFTTFEDYNLGHNSYVKKKINIKL